MPLRVGERSLGVLVLLSMSAERRFTETDRVFIEELAGRAALALDNARLLREAQAALELIGVAAHDLGNPLNALQLTLGKLRRTPSADADKLREGLGAALRQTQRLGRLLHNLLDLSRLSSGQAGAGGGGGGPGGAGARGAWSGTRTRRRRWAAGWCWTRSWGWWGGGTGCGWSGC